MTKNEFSITVSIDKLVKSSVICTISYIVCKWFIVIIIFFLTTLEKTFLLLLFVYLFIFETTSSYSYKLYRTIPYNLIN